MSVAPFRAAATHRRFVFLEGAKGAVHVGANALVRRRVRHTAPPEARRAQRHKAGAVVAL